MVDQKLRATRLRLTVTGCRPDEDDGSPSWRVGGTVTTRHAGDHHALVEYCHVVAARARLSESGRLLPGLAVPDGGEGRGAGESGLTESLAAGS